MRLLSYGRERGVRDEHSLRISRFVTRAAAVFWLVSVAGCGNGDETDLGTLEDLQSFVDSAMTVDLSPARDGGDSDLAAGDLLTPDAGSDAAARDGAGDGAPMNDLGSAPSDGGVDLAAIDGGSMDLARATDLAPPADLSHAADFSQAPDLVVAEPAFCPNTKVAGTCAQAFFGGAEKCFNPTGACTATQDPLTHNFCWATGAVYLSSFNDMTLHTDLLWKHGGNVCMSGVATGKGNLYSLVFGGDKLVYDIFTGDVTCPDGSKANIGINGSDCKTLQALLFTVPPVCAAGKCP